MNRLHAVAAMAVLGGTLAVGPVLAQDPGAGNRRGPGPRGPIARDGGLELRGLNLTDQQREQIRTLRQQHREQNEQAFARLRAAMEAQRKAIEAAPVDEQAIRATTQQLAEAQTEVAIQRARLRAEVFALLTPEQQAQAAKFRAEHEQRRLQMRQRLQQRQK